MNDAVAALVWRRNKDDRGAIKAEEKAADAAYVIDVTTPGDVAGLVSDKVLPSLPVGGARNDRLVIARGGAAATWGSRTKSDQKFAPLARVAAQELQVPYIHPSVTPCRVEWVDDPMPIRPAKISVEDYARFCPLTRASVGTQNMMGLVFASPRATPLLEFFDEALATIQGKLAAYADIKVGAMTVGWVRRHGGDTPGDSKGQHIGRWGIRKVTQEAAGYTGGYNAEALIYDGPVWMIQPYYLIPDAAKNGELYWKPLPGYIAVDPVEYVFVASPWCQRESGARTSGYDMISGFYAKHDVASWLAGPGASQLSGAGTRAPRKLYRPPTDETKDKRAKIATTVGDLLVRPALPEHTFKPGGQHFMNKKADGSLVIMRSEGGSGGAIKEGLQFSRDLGGGLIIKSFYGKQLLDSYNCNFQFTNEEAAAVLDAYWEDAE